MREREGLAAGAGLAMVLRGWKRRTAEAPAPVVPKIDPADRARIERELAEER